jgi:hypothetical protein
MKSLKTKLIEFIQTFITEELQGMVIIRELGNPQNVIKHYDTMYVPRVGDFITLGLDERQYRVEKVVFTTVSSIANIYINL